MYSENGSGEVDSVCRCEQYSERSALACSVSR